MRYPHDADDVCNSDTCAGHALLCSATECAALRTACCARGLITSPLQYHVRSQSACCCVVQAPAPSLCPSLSSSSTPVSTLSASTSPTAPTRSVCLCAYVWSACSSRCGALQATSLACLRTLSRPAVCLTARQPVPWPHHRQRTRGCCAGGPPHCHCPRHQGPRDPHRPQPGRHRRACCDVLLYVCCVLHCCMRCLISH